MRAPFQVLVILYRVTINAALEFAALKRQDLDIWQGGVAGGG